MPSSACDWSSDVCSSDRSEEHTSELQSRSDLVCRIISSEEHTSELQSRSDLVCRLLLEKKNNHHLRRPLWSAAKISGKGATRYHRPHTLPVAADNRQPC